MRRLALLGAAVLAVAAAPSVRAEPLDLDLSRLGAPDPQVWTTIGFPVGADQLAKDSRARFATLTSNLALALSSAVLQPASTTGHTGFAVDLEIATMPVESGKLAAAPPGAPAGFSTDIWPTESRQPTALYLPSVHFRKAFPFSLEFGGRMIYLSGSNYFAGQGEAKWALNEGFDYIPDVAVRGAYTRLFGAKDLALSATDLDFMISKRWGIQGVTSLTPYVVARFTYVSASTDRIDFAPVAAAPTTDLSTQASFPAFSAGYYRTTFGVRFTAYSVALGLEGTYFGGATPSSKEYEGVKIASSFGGAAKLGWEW
jgi:hypothetical protein